MDDKQRERLAQLRQADAEREAKAQEEAELRELEARELVQTLEGTGMKRGHDFEIIDNPICGVFALRKPDREAIRKWENASEKNRLNLEWQISLLKGYIVDPSEGRVPAAGPAGSPPPQLAPGTRVEGRRAIEWAQACGQRPGLCWQTANAFVDLMGVDREALQKK